MQENLANLTGGEVVTNPPAFMQFVTRTWPFEYQENILNDNSKRIIWRAGRQIGKTAVIAIKILFRAFTRYKEQILIIAPTLRQSNILFSKILSAISSNEIIKKYTNENEGGRLTKTMVTFYHTMSEIIAVPAGRYGYNIMGYSPTLVVWEEAAYIPDEVYSAIEPSVAATDGDMIYIAKPFGKRGKFWELWNMDQKDFPHYWTKSKECPLITAKFLAEKKAEIPETEYLQEYEGEFIEEADAFFSKELIIKFMGDADEQ